VALVILLCAPLLASHALGTCKIVQIAELHDTGAYDSFVSGGTANRNSWCTGINPIFW
jgi:hypothetical protein